MKSSIKYKVYFCLTEYSRATARQKNELIAENESLVHTIHTIQLHMLFYVYFSVVRILYLFCVSVFFVVVVFRLFDFFDDNVVWNAAFHSVTIQIHKAQSNSSHESEWKEINIWTKQNQTKPIQHCTCTM